MTKDEQVKEIKRLEAFFSKAEIPEGKIKLNKYLTSTNLKSTIESGLIRAKSCIGGFGIEAMIDDLKIIEDYLRNK